MMEPASPESAKPDPGLPPVQPPSGRFIVQLFVIPGLIILVLVLGLMAWNYVQRRQIETAHFLDRLDSPNLDARWRAASDLAQILKRNEPATLRWKADPTFALELARRLDDAFDSVVKEEKIIGERVANSTDKDKHLQWRALRNQRAHLTFLAGALGEFHVAAGAPVLCKILNHADSPDLKGNTLQRRQSIWALMNLGENLKGYSKIPAPDQEALVATLKEEAAGKEPRASWARTALFYIDQNAVPSGNLQGVTKVDECLIACADAEDQFLRKLVAMSFNFWNGPRVDAALLKLARDQGHGTLVRVEEND